MSKICIIGHFAFGKELLNGQTVKTQNFYRALCEKYGSESISTADTHGLSRNPVKTLRLCFACLKDSENVVLLPAQNGVRVLVPLFVLLNRFYHRRLYYNVIGGWLPSMLSKRRVLSHFVRRLDGVLVETRQMKTAMEALGFSNLHVVVNFKFLVPLTQEQLVFNRQEPFPLCTFSRVMEEKGIEDAVDAVTAVNHAYGRTVYTLDIYGSIDENYRMRFSELQSRFPPFVRYQGEVPSEDSVAVLRSYFALLFPTHRLVDEGLPGTLIDALFAGVPVLSARWESFDDVVLDGVTGFGFPSGDIDALAGILKASCEDPERLNRMKGACLERTEKYLPDKALSPFYELLQTSCDENKDK